MKTNLLLMLFAFLFLANNTKAETTIVLQPNGTEGKDAYITSSRPNINANGGTNAVITWTDEGNLCITRSFLAFDLSQIPDNATITSAKLSLFYNPTDLSQSFDYQTGENASYIQRVTSEWDESAINWNNQPTTTTVDQISLLASTSQTQDYIDIDVTTLVDSMKTYGNYGFMMRMQNETSYYRGLIFASSEHETENLRPKLEISWTIPESGCTTIQPNGTEGKDAYITSSRPNINANGGTNAVITWTDEGNLCITRSFLAFDLSQIPDNATITSAKLSLFYNPTDLSQSFDYQTGENASYIQRVTSEWDESAINWNNQPTTTTVDQISLLASTSQTQDYIDIDVTTLVDSMKTYGNYGFMIRMQNETSYYRGLIFASSEHETENLRPKLEICWTIPESGCTTIQPNGTEGKDAYITSSRPNINANGGTNAVITWTDGGNLCVTRSFLAFDLSQIPNNATITSAKLSLFYNPTDLSQSFDYQTGENASYIQRVTSEWNESAINWNNQPTTTTVDQISLLASTSQTQDYIDIDVTSLVDSMKTYGNHGFMIRMQNETSYYRGLIFASSEHETENLRPKLEVCWSNIPNGIIPIKNSKNNKKEKVIEIYPNPNNGKFSLISREENLSLSNIEIFDLLGNKINFEMNGNEIEINKNGIFILKVVDENGKMMSQKVIVK